MGRIIRIKTSGGKLNNLDVHKEKIWFHSMDQHSHLRSLQALGLALRTGSLRGAASQLAITPAAVGQRVKALEDYLGVDLLVRGRSGLQPTLELRGALPHLHAAFRELALAADLLELQHGQQIRIAAASGIADLWLAPRLIAFRAKHPNMELEVNGEGELPRRMGAADCEIFFGPVGGARSPDERLGELLFHDHVLPVTSPENERRVAALGGSARLEGFPLLHVDFYRNDPQASKWPEWLSSQGLTRTAPERGIRFQRIASAMDAVMANAGFPFPALSCCARRLRQRGSLCRFRDRPADARRMRSRFASVPRRCSIRSCGAFASGCLRRGPRRDAGWSHTRDSGWRVRTTGEIFEEDLARARRTSDWVPSFKADA